MISETLIIIINVENAVLLNIFVETMISFFFFFFLDSLMNRKFKRTAYIKNKYFVT